MKLRLVITGRQYDRGQPLGEELTVPDGAALDDALRTLAGLLPPDRPLPGTCLVAVAGRHLGTIADHRSEPLREGDELLLFTPVAGG
jgi:molybdopterin converting factor small subunit